MDKIIDFRLGLWDEFRSTHTNPIEENYKYFLIGELLKARNHVFSNVNRDRAATMRNKAITIFELTKGFCGEPTDNAMKAALEMAGYVMELTNDIDDTDQ